MFSLFENSLQPAEHFVFLSFPQPFFYPSMPHLRVNLFIIW